MFSHLREYERHAMYSVSLASPVFTLCHSLVRKCPQVARTQGVSLNNETTHWLHCLRRRDTQRSVFEKCFRSETMTLDVYAFPVPSKTFVHTLFQHLDERESERKAGYIFICCSLKQAASGEASFICESYSMDHSFHFEVCSSN